MEDKTNSGSDVEKKTDLEGANSTNEVNANQESKQTPSKPNRKKILVIAGIVAGLSLFVGSATAAYYKYYLPNQPENVIKQALANTLSEQSLLESGKIEGQLSVSGNKNLNANVSFEIENSDSGGFSATIKTFGVSAQLISEDGKTVYLKLDGLKGVDKLLETYENTAPIKDNEALIKSVLPLLDKVNGNWYELDSSLLSGQKTLQEALPTGLSEQQVEQVAKIYEQNEFIVFDKKGGESQVGGVKATEYIVHIDGQKLLSFFKEVQKANIDKLSITDEDIKSLEDFVNKYDLSNYPFSLWIDQDKNIVKFYYSHQYESAKVELELTRSKTGNKPIKKPEDSKTLFELLGDIQPILQNLQELELETLPEPDN